MRITTFFGFIATAFAASALSHGFDSLKREDLGMPVDLAPFASATTSDGGLWLLAPGTSDTHQLVRLDASGNRLFSLHLPTRVDATNSDRFSIYPLPDGGVLELDTHNRSASARACILRSVTRDGALRFERDVRQPACSVKLNKLGAAPYLLSNTDGAVLLSEDGALASSFLPSVGVASLLRAEFINGERELLLLRNNDAQTGYVLTRANDNGTTAWSTPLDNVRVDQNVTIRGLVDGRALVLIADSAKLQMRFYSSTGALLEFRDIVMPEFAQAAFGVWALDGQGNHALALTFAAVGSVNHGAVLFAPDGAVIKQVRYPLNAQCTADCPMLGLDQGFANALTTPTGGKLVLTSLSPNVANVDAEVAGAFKPRIARSSNDTILMTSDRVFRAFNVAGVEITAPSVVGKGVTQEKNLATIVAEDGKSFVVHQNFANGQSITQLDAFAATGSNIWQHTISDVGSAELWANANRVCVSKLNSNDMSDATLACFASSTGDELTSIVIPNLDVPLKRSRFLADGRLRVVYVVGTIGVKIVDVLSDGSVSEVSIATNPVNAIIDIGATGGVLVAAGATGSSIAIELLALRPSGEIAYRRPIGNSDSLSQFSARMLENSDVLVSSPSLATPSTTFNIVLLNADGVQRWAVTSARLNANDYLANSLADPINVYLLRRTGPGGTLQVKALSRLNGGALWTQALKIDQESVTDVYPAPNSKALLVSVSRETGVQLSRLSDISGALLEQRLFDCGIVSCTLRATAITSVGDFHAVSDTQEFGRIAVALGRVAVASIAPEVSADQTGLSGAWYTPQISGQGFFVEYFPQSKLMFAPWFTFSEAVVSSNGEVLTTDSVAQLRWYTLSGIVEPGAKVARLEIRRNVGGVFDSLPITQSTVVGSATLRAQDCNRATLEFEFINGEAGGKKGVLPLDRLTGGFAPCQLSDGQMLSGRDARPAFGGIDGRQNGSWYEPATDGQGLMLTVQPATVATPGFLFGGWFTYDAGSPNDPTAQHWLTLSAEIRPDAQFGVVPFKIYRTLGGELGRAPTQNNMILGQGTLTFSGCSSAVMRYQFDDTIAVGAFRARIGEINLQRLGACPTQ